MAADGAGELLQAKVSTSASSVSKEATEHDTLKYHLLGPSLTKAGQDTVDQQKVSEVIYNASKGSKFFNNEEVKDKNLTQKIERILVKKRQLERLDLASDRRRADDYITELEMTRDLSQTVVHIDCDAFYAAVEELDRPELKDVPMAVGKGVLTTCNYHARKFGCRSGMAGFVAQKLCPDLISLPLNFEKYTAKAQEIRTILAEYDPRFESASIDEAYLNITDYCNENDLKPWDAVMQLRAEVHEKCRITISAGLAPNAKIAKVASNRNKPNGQFMVTNDRVTVLAFMRDLPTRKVNGIGRVFERELDAIGVKTCGDIYSFRQYLSKLFGEKAFQFLMQTYLGLGRTSVQPAEDYERKSVGTESTFRDMSDPNELRDKLRWIAEELEKDMTRTQFKGRTLVLKIKLYTYEVLTRQFAPPKAVCSADDLYNYALPMFAKLEKEIPTMKLRLMGLRCTHLVSTKKPEKDFFGMGLQRFSSTDSHDSDGNNSSRTVTDNKGEWQVWPDSEFEASERQERQAELEEAERLSQEYAQQECNEEEALEEANRRRKHGREILPNPIPREKGGQKLDSGIGFRKPETGYKKPEPDKPVKEVWRCPVCQRPQDADERSFNEHVDFCLSKQAIKETAQEHFPLPLQAVALRETAGRENANERRRGRSSHKRKLDPADRGMKKLCSGVAEKG
ncbi:uncharacterized protein KY384_001820 [Bacidia gigantensis]|uniref:uncharacterized protein n=1 Tax=Bacidia gigantensis TaxID=2732470 RepID=UPI001D03FB0B|nr:uncharacterized protein KY384_001820 [Bacidia gigantensis]KAG8533037.1 hypothetical protein KY384_001820 [Bacidia gigantensis]